MERMEQEQQPVQFNTEGIRFPFATPYKLQTRMMNMISEAIEKKKHLLIQSPTGTGKTLCLLSATLSATENKKIKRVYYLTRTHSQMDGIVKEIKTTSYQPKFTPLQSMRPLCVHEPVQEIGKNMNIEELQALCDLARSSKGQKRQQMYGGRLHHCSRQTSWTVKNQEKISLEVQFPPFNMINKLEDIKGYAQSQGHCPFYYTKALSKKAELIIMSYIYLLNPFIFLAKEFDLQNSVIIFDEAHNVIQQAKEQNSTIIRQKNISKAISDLQNVSPMLDGMEDLNTKNTLLNYALQLSKLMQKLQKFYDKNKNSQIISIKKVKEITQCNFEGFYAFQKVNSQIISDILLRISSLYNGDNEGSKKPKSKLKTIINNCFILDLIFKNHVEDDTYLCILQKKKIQKKDSFWFEFSAQFYCTTSKYVFKKFQKSTMLFASGTLQKQQFYKDTELKFMNAFEIQYQNNENPYENNNVERFELSYSNGKELQITHNNPNHKQILHLLKQIIPLIPNGVLVFFKNSTYMTVIKDMIRQNNIDFKNKELFYEIDQLKQFKLSLKQYKQAAMKHDGAVFFSYMRGKLSQGVNFKDELARAVFVVGLPLISQDSTQYKIHKHLLTVESDFWRWWTKNAMQAVNQAVGRVLRHSKDYGQVFLLGKKLCSNSNKLPKWLQKTRYYTKSGTQFIKDMIQKFYRGREGRVVQNIEHVYEGINRESSDGQLFYEEEFEDQS